MSRDPRVSREPRDLREPRDPRDPRKAYWEWDRNRDPRDRGRDREYRHPIPKRSRSPLRDENRRSRSPRNKEDKDLDENILSEISKLPEPSELWEPNQFGDAGFAPPPPSFPPPESNPSYSNYPTQSYLGIYDDFPPVATVPPTPHPPDIANWNTLSLPPPPTAAPQFSAEDQIKKEAAIESEMRHQKAALSKQREDYMKKTGILKKELETLKDQRNELRGDPKRSPSPDTKRFLKENTKLQLEIQNKLKTINNVVDMLNGIIGEEAAEAAPGSGDSSPERKTKRKSRSPTNKKFNYVYYDPEMHWCRVCNEFPPTAKDYLNHLHSAPHQKMAAAHMEAPWHSVTAANEGFPSFPSAPTKRTPIRGLQFFVPSTAWYCKLCDQFIGDLHCASAHLKSIVHSKNYTNFVEQNPHWETDWMSDRQKAFEKARGTKPKREEEAAKAAAAAAAAQAAASRYAAHTITFNKDGFHTKRKESPPPPPETKDDKQKKKKKEKKKKIKKKKSKSSSSSSSDSSDSSDSDADDKKKKRKKRMAKIAEARLNESDRQLLDSLTNRMTRARDARDTRETRDTREARDSRDERDASRKREPERRPSRSRESPRREGREGRGEREGREGRGEREGREERGSRGRSGSRGRGRSPSRSTRSPARKPEVKKMPFIGKMPVYKNLSKTIKTEEQKKEEVKKKEEEEATKKRRDEMDAEIQKKVAEFKEKIARAQIQHEIGPPAIALPTSLGTPVAFLPPPPAPAPAPAPPPPQPAALMPTPTPPTPSNLSKDFQDALDIIFPSEVKKQAAEMVQQQELFAAAMPFGVMPPFPPLGLLPPPGMPPPGMPPPGMPPGMMMDFLNSQNLNPNLFPPRPQLYDTHVPLVPSPKQRQPNKRPQNNHNQKNYNQQQNKPQAQNQSKPQTQNPPPPQKSPAPAQKPAEKQKEENGSVARKKEELDEMAMLGIDAGDVAGM